MEGKNKMKTEKTIRQIMETLETLQKKYGEDHGKELLALRWVLMPEVSQ